MSFKSFWDDLLESLAIHPFVISKYKKYPHNNPLSPDINLQILQTDLHTFP